ncbi:MAG: 3-keto-5-aminohexanoate cleavage protein [Nakamurella sp.]
MPERSLSERSLSESPPDRGTAVPANTGTLITLAPAACPLGHLLRAAIDAEQVGASRIHLAIDQPDFVAVVAGLRRQTGLVITTDPDHPGADLVDRLPTDFLEVVIDEGPSQVDLVAQVARIAEERDGEVSLGGRGEAAVPVLFAALAVGAHVRVGTSQTPLEPPSDDLRGDRRPRGRDDAALVARASGLARIAGRFPLEGASARSHWRVG